jgi:ABC-type lipoprotein release transport system permease subunit
MKVALTSPKTFVERIVRARRRKRMMRIGALTGVAMVALGAAAFLVYRLYWEED